MDFFKQIFNSQTLANMGIVSSIVTVIREVLKQRFNLRGAPAVILTFLVSVGYSILQFGLQTEYGIVYGAVLGIATALSYYVVKNTGAIVGGNSLQSNLHQNTRSILVDEKRENQIGKLSVWQVVKFVLFRKLILFRKS